MKISYNWLKTYLNIDLPYEKVADLLTGCGLEVENTETFETVKGGLKGIVIGEVKTCIKHPDADKLSITTVDVGGDDLLRIVCGAPNVATGQKVVVATIGSVIYKEEGSFVIKKSKIRGELSEGMICAEDEIGLGNSHEGIMVLKNDAVIGMPAKEYFGIESDIIFEIGLTPNRSDAICHLGVARDLYAILKLSDFNVCLKEPDVSEFSTDNQNFTIDIIVEDTDACPRYTGITLSGIEVKESPDWLKNRLLSIGQRPINNIVDITNFVLHETGQPLHAFDADSITGKKVIVKKLPENTNFTTLDNVDRKLSDNDLMICNKNEGMCIAGVFGGEKTGVNYNTKNIFLESAYFEPTTIRKTSKFHGLKTDASFRFERGTDPNITVYALKRAILLMKEIAGGNVSSDIIDIYPKPIEKKQIEISFENVYNLTGKIIDKEIIRKILASLGIEIINQSETGIKLLIPTNKVDVTREADVIEEILRIYGYNNIDISTNLHSSISYINKPDKEKVQNNIANLLSNNGFFEIMNNSLTSSSYYSKTGDFINSSGVKILNPLSKELDILRQTLIFGGLETISYNLNRKITSQKLFEFGKIYFYNSNIEKSLKVTKRFKEEKHLSLFLTGNKNSETWYVYPENVDFFTLKSFVINILKKLRIDIENFTINKTETPIFSEVLIYSLNELSVVEIGVIQQKLLNGFDIKQDVFVADLNWDIILKLLPKSDIVVKEIPKFPEVRRDLSLLINEQVSFSDIVKLAYQTEKQLLKKVNLFDVYKGEKLEKGKKSYAVSFILQDNEKTLNDKQIDGIMNRLIKIYIDKLGAVIR